MKKINKVGSVFILMTLLLSILAGLGNIRSVKASGNDYISVINQNIRVQPKDIAGPVVYLEEGEAVQKIRTVGDWFEVGYNGQRGYIHRGDVTSQKNYNNSDRKFIQLNTVREPNAKNEYYVAIDTNLRTRNTGNASSLKLMQQDDKVSYLGTIDNWFLIDHKGVKGYVHRGDVSATKVGEGSREVHKVPLKDKTQFDQLKVVIDRNLRTKDGRNFGAVKTLRRGDIVNYIGRTNNDWFRVEHEGKQGYIYRGDVTSYSTKPVTPDTGETKPTKGEIEVSKSNGLEYVITATSLNMREGDSTDYKILKRISEGQTVKHLGTVKNNKNWYKVDYKGTVGFVHSRYLKEKIQSQPEPEEKPGDNISVTKPNGLEYVTTPPSLNFRAGNSTKYEVIGKLPKGTTVKHLGTADNGWFQIEHNGLIGFVSSSYLTLKKDEVSVKGSMVFLDYGHGGWDPGAIGIGGRKEKDDTLRIGLLIAEKLRNKGVIVDEFRTSDPNREIKISERTNMANQKKYDYFVSIHRNSYDGTVDGAETLVYNKSSTKAISLANEIQKNLQSVGFYNRGIKYRKNLHVLKRTKAPAVLVEVGFIDNITDNWIFDNKLNNVAESISDGIVAEIIKNK